MSQLVILLPVENKEESKSLEFGRKWADFIDELFAAIYDPEMYPTFNSSTWWHCTTKRQKYLTHAQSGHIDPDAVVLVVFDNADMMIRRTTFKHAYALMTNEFSKPKKDEAAKFFKGVFFYDDLSDKDKTRLRDILEPCIVPTEPTAPVVDTSTAPVRHVVEPSRVNNASVILEHPKKHMMIIMSTALLVL